MTIESPGKFWSDYELIDSGNFEKLERFGPYIMARPEPKALWDKSLSEGEWNKMIHTRFKTGAGFGKAGKEDSGTWERHRKMDDQWYIRYNGAQEGLKFSLRLGLTSFKHVGVFPEQSSNWEYIYRQTRALVEKAEAEGKPKPKVLNLFAYTGAASLAAKAAGADVTHLDSVRQVVTWARGNMEASRLDNIRWIVEDALKFARRETRQHLSGYNPGPSCIRTWSGRRKMEAGRVPERYASVCGGHSCPTGQLHGSEPLLERIFGGTRRDNRQAGILHKNRI